MKLCEKCKKVEGQFNFCEGDGRLHHHGMVHTIDGDLKWLCKKCADEEGRRWKDKRK